MSIKRGVYRCDISTLRPVERRPDGTIRVDAFLSKCGVFQYMQPDGSIRRELRLPEDVHDPKSLQSFDGVPVTNNHPPGMVDAKNARQYMVGALLGTPIPDSDHMRGRLAVYDDATVQDMNNGKVQVSNGYTCDCEEKPGIHPLYGAYDAIQRNIRGNHVAIVDRARAGVTAAARMDGAPEPWQVGMMVLEPGTQIAVDATPAACKSRAMSQPTARIEVVVKHDAGEPSASAKVDPEDLASRNAAGKTAAKKAAKTQPGESYEDDGNDRAKPRKGKPFPPDDEDDDEDDEEREDASRMSDDDDDEDDDEDDSDDDSDENDDDDEDADEAPPKKRGAAAKKDNAMDIKDLQAKADKRKTKLVKAKARIDALEIELAEKDAQIENMKRDSAAKKDAADAPKMDAAEIQKHVDAKIELLDRARQTGATVTSKMDDLEIQRVTVKHVDGKDVPEARKDDASYVLALFEGACERAKKDAADTKKGASALDAARIAAEQGRQNPHLDAAASTDEDAAKAKLAAANRQMINQPSISRRAARN